MPLSVRKFIIPAATLGMLGLVTALIALAGPTAASAQSIEPFVVNGKVVIEGQLPHDGTIIYVRIDGRRDRIWEAKVEDGRFRLTANEPSGFFYQGKLVEFFSIMADGQEVRFPQTAIWQPGETHFIALDLPAPEPVPEQPVDEPSQPLFPIPGLSNLPGVSSIRGVPEGIDIACVFRVLGRMPSGPQDMTAQESLKIAQNCFTGGGASDASAHLEQEKERLEFERKLQKEQRALEEQRLEEDRRLQQEYDRLEKERLDRDRARQEEQARLDQERLQLEQDRIRREQEFEEQLRRQDDERERRRLEQERKSMEQEFALQRERMDQQRKLDEERFEQERRLDDERARLEEERIKQEQDRIQREFAQREEQLRREQELERRDFGGGPVGSPDLATLECIRGVLGYLPADPQEMAPEQRNVVGTACPGARGRLGQVLNPIAVDQSNRECAERVLGNLPETMTSDERQRMLEACFGVEPTSGAPAPNRGPTRGFFTNTSVGGLGTVNQFFTPTMLAVFGILLTLGATVMQMVKGS